ncbi:TetR family transcriptional regulator [Pseudorhodoferax sp. Leaf267]|uniref:TetR family transcriptional regulator n=1 Tax=Pseudorhodoferax sp. Leaf267 TaxID=1736316 RepID=UPI0006FA0F54|nr:TetR family transcriptional regulator [Pseudorhodoferax sp. Leaf267]KQP21677.1 TetR family transcriptional regulator [Pseudorhodoferax sp. Leaf267]
MARRTKEEAQATRHRLLDAAETLFQARGVSRTSLQDIATAAGATRGAIYWHFKDKADLFNAMMERVTLPLEQSLQPGSPGHQAMARDALGELRAAILRALAQLKADAKLRGVVDIAMQKVEYIDELHAVRDRHRSVRDKCIVDIATALRLAARQAGRRLPLPAVQAAEGLHALIDGLIRNWLLDTATFDLPVLGEQVIDVYLAGLGLRPAPAARNN